MSNPIDSDTVTFTPNRGGLGVRIAVTSVASTPTGLVDAGDGGDRPPRIRVANLGSVTAFVRFGGAADLNSIAILPGTVEVFGAPYSNPNGISVSAITESGTTTVSVVAGVGS